MSSLTMPMPRQDHDVDGGVRIEPEQVLEQERVSAERGIEDAEVEEAFDSDEHDGDGDDRRAQNLMMLVA